MCRTTNSGIDSTNKATGRLDVALDARTATFLAAVNNSASVRGYFELWGYDTNGDQCFYICVPITCRMVVDPDGGTPPEPESDLVGRAVAESMLARQLIYEYSADGEESHSAMTAGDIYFRVRHGATGVASAWQLIPYGPQGEQGDPGDTGPAGVDANCTVKAAATTGAAITFTAATAIYKFAPTAASTVTFTAPVLSADQVYEAELWITQGEVPVALTFPTVTWAGGTAQDMSKPGLYRLGLTYDGTDWFARTIQVRDDSYKGSYEDGDPGVYVYVDGNLIRSAQNAADWELNITGSTVYVVGSTTTFSGSTIGADIYVETNKYDQQSSEYLGGGTISDVVLDGGAIWATNSTFVNCTFTSGELGCDGGTLTNCFIGSNVSNYNNYPFCATINGGTINSNIGGFDCILNGVTVDVGSGNWFDCATSATNCLFLSGFVTGLTLTSGTINGAGLMDAGASGDVVWVRGDLINTSAVIGINIGDILCDGGTMTDCYITGTADASMGQEINGGTVAAGAHIKYGQDCTYVDGLTVLAGGTITVYSGGEAGTPTVVSVDTVINNDPNQNV